MKSVSLRWNLVSRLFRICKIRWWCSFSCFRPFFASFVQKYIWHFDYLINLLAVYSQRLETSGFLVISWSAQRIWQKQRAFSFGGSIFNSSLALKYFHSFLKGAIGYTTIIRKVLKEMINSELDCNRFDAFFLYEFSFTNIH